MKESRIKDVKLDLYAELGRKQISIEELSNITEGTVVQLNQLAGNVIRLKVGTTIVAKGEIVVIKDNYGVRVTQVMKRE